jgi:hypothetical protein
MCPHYHPGFPKPQLYLRFEWNTNFFQMHLLLLCPSCWSLENLSQSSAMSLILIQIYVFTCFCYQMEFFLPLPKIKNFRNEQNTSTSPSPPNMDPILCCLHSWKCVQMYVDPHQLSSAALLCSFNDAIYSALRCQLPLSAMVHIWMNSWTGIVTVLFRTHVRHSLASSTDVRHLNTKLNQRY